MTHRATILFGLAICCQLSITDSFAQSTAHSKTSKCPQVWTFGAYKLIDVSFTDYSEETDDDPGSNVTASYPKMVLKSRTSDSFLQLLRDTIHSEVLRATGGVDMHHANHRTHARHQPKYEPFTYQLSYSLFANDSLISIVFNEYQMACCGASGSSDVAIAINADLRTKRFLTVGDLVRPEAVHAFDSLVRHNFKAQQSDEPITYTYDSTSTAFSFSEQGVSIHIDYSDAGHGWTEFSFIPFEGHRQIFRPAFLRALPVRLSDHHR
jgi:hypothetical protein